MKKGIVVGIIVVVAILVGVSFSQGDNQDEEANEILPTESLSEPKHYSESLSESASISTP